MDRILQEATKILVKKDVAVHRYKCVYVDDIFGIQKQNATKTAHIKFASCLSQVDPRLKVTHVIEENKQHPFLDAPSLRQPNGSLKTKVYRKQSHTSVTIRLNSNQDPKTWIGVLKGALCCAHCLCSHKERLTK